MAGIELATAYISLVPSTDGFEKKLNAALKGVGRGVSLTPTVKPNITGVEQSGRSAADNLLSSFQRQAARRSDSIGRSVGTVIGRGMGVGITAGVGAATAGLAAAVGGIGFSLNRGFQRLNAIDQAEFKLRALGHTSSEVAKITRDVTEVVKGTPIALDEAFSSAVSFIGNGVEAGEELNGVLAAVADAAGFSGTSFQDLGLIFGQVMNKGKLQAEEMLQLNERNIPIQSYLRKEFDLTAEQLESMSKNGEVSFQMLVQAVEGNLGGMAKRMGETMQGSIDNAQAAAGRFGASLITAVSGGDTSNLTDGIDSLTTKLDDLTAWTKDHVPEIIGGVESIGNAFIDAGSGAMSLYKFLLEGQRAMTLGVAYTSFGEGRERAFADADAMAATIKGIDKEIEKNQERKRSWQDAQESAAKAAEFTEDLQGAIAERQGDNVVLKAPTVDDLNKINEAKYRIEAIPDSADFRIVPRTEEATSQLNAWRNKQEANPADVKAEADTRPAEQQMGAWRTDEQGRPVRIPAEVLLEKAQADLDAFVVNAPKSISMMLQLTTGMTPTGSAPGGGAAGINPLDAFAPTRSNPTNANTGGALTPETQAVQDYLRNELGFTGTIGGWREDANYPDEHPAGKASDVMIRSKQEGYALLPNLLRQPGVEYILWDNKQWNPDGSSSSGISSPHTDHLHVKTYDQGGWLPPGVTLAQNKTGKPEYILTPEEIEELRKQGIDPASIQHGTAQGAPPGPTPEQLRAVQEPAQAGRTEGYIPAGAGFTGKTGGGVAGSLLGLGEQAIHGLIDQAVSAASTAASITPAGPGGGAAASAALGIAGNIGKRAASYGFDLANIGIGAITEQLTPFGAPRWLSDVDPTSFMPQMDIMPALTTTLEEGAQAAAQQSAVDPATTQHGAGMGLPPGPVTPQAIQGLDVLSRATQEASQLTAAPGGNDFSVHLHNPTTADADDLAGKIAKQQRLQAMRYSGRP